MKRTISLNLNMASENVNLNMASENIAAAMNPVNFIIQRFENYEFVRYKKAVPFRRTQY